MKLVSLRAALLVSTALAACGLAGSQATAGGFAIREQSAQFLGSAFAGAAAGGGLSSMYWNPAALGQAGWGFTGESHYSGIFGQSESTVESYNGVPAGLLPFGVDSGDIANPALVGASYYSHRWTDRLTLGLSLTSGFGLTTKPRDPNYLGAELGQTTKLFTINAAPTLAYQIAPGITIGAGVQVQYARAKLAFASGAPIGPSSIYDDADDFAFGATAGVLFEPRPGTSIGIGYRSQLSHTLEGDFASPLVGGKVGADVDLDLPEIVTLSFRQAIAPNMRLLGTVEWTNWSRFASLVLNAEGPFPPSGTTIATIPSNWSDGWFFSLGGEYDLQPGFTLRAGGAYEISPVDDPTKRFTSIPDADRVWLAGGATVQLTDSMVADFAYAHVFIENGDFDRVTLAGNRITGYSESQVDIFSVSLKTKWGGERPLEPLK